VIGEFSRRLALIELYELNCTNWTSPVFIRTVWVFSVNQPFGRWAGFVRISVHQPGLAPKRLAKTVVVQLNTGRRMLTAYGERRGGKT